MKNTSHFFVTQNEKLLCIKGTEHFFSVCRKTSDFVTETVAENIEEKDAHLFAAAPDMSQALQAIVSDYEALRRSQGAQVNIGSDFTAAEWLGSRLGGHIAKAKNLISKAKGEV
jgi:hypothetical protein